MSDLRNPYRQLPSETGGQAYHMECEFCHEWSSMYSSAPFIHAADCPASKLEQEEFAQMREKREKGIAMGKGFLRFLVRVGYLIVLGLTAGIIMGMLGFNEGLRPILLIGIMILYWSTIQKIFTKLGIAKPATPVPPQS